LALATSLEKKRSAILVADTIEKVPVCDELRNRATGSVTFETVRLAGTFKHFRLKVPVDIRLL
jgi:hypothetical protein